MTEFKKLKTHMDYCLSQCERDHKELWLHQAFGAVQYVCLLCDPKDFEKVCQIWNEQYKPSFEIAIWGSSLTLG